MRNRELGRVFFSIRLNEIISNWKINFQENRTKTTWTVFQLPAAHSAILSSNRRMKIMRQHNIRMEQRKHRQWFAEHKLAHNCCYLRNTEKKSPIFSLNSKAKPCNSIFLPVLPSSVSAQCTQYNMHNAQSNYIIIVIIGKKGRKNKNKFELHL